MAGTLCTQRVASVGEVVVIFANDRNAVHPRVTSVGDEVVILAHLRDAMHHLRWGGNGVNELVKKSRNLGLVCHSFALIIFDKIVKFFCCGKQTDRIFLFFITPRV